MVILSVASQSGATATSLRRLRKCPRDSSVIMSMLRVGGARLYSTQVGRARLGRRLAVVRLNAPFRRANYREALLAVRRPPAFFRGDNIMRLNPGPAILLVVCFMMVSLFGCGQR